MLKECNMDPNETTHKLLFQGLCFSYVISLCIFFLLLCVHMYDFRLFMYVGFV